jgi:hypothetical protein
MTRKFIPVEEAFDRWQKDPEFVAAYDALTEEFSLVSSNLLCPSQGYFNLRVDPAPIGCLCVAPDHRDCGWSATTANFTPSARNMALTVS